MTAYDWIVLALFVAFIARGWTRGFVRQAIDVGLLLLGSVVVFRLSPVIGSIVAGMANVPYEVGRVVAGVIVFVLLVVGSIVVGNLVAAALHVVPGAATANRLGGAAVGAVFAAIVVLVGTTLISVVPLPSSWRSGVDGAVGSSPAGQAITDPTGPVQSIVAGVSGVDLFASVIAVQDAVGDRLMAGTLPIPFPSVGDAALAPSQADAQAVFDRLNLERIEAGVDPLAWSSDLAVIAVSRAMGVYDSGVLALEDDLDDAFRAAGVPGTVHTDMVVLAASRDGVVEAITGASGYAADVVDPVYRKAGLGVVHGPYGLMTVQVLSG